ncbi:hypothetical protein ACFQ7W_02065 [Streptomyces niveus]|uniref:hypothetical protein n=1 Tax=Streptomyces niveus TaxID=193462 RepID=UPI00367B3032
MAADRYRTAPGATSYTRDQGIGWSEYRLDKRFERVRANAELAALFECEPGERLLARYFVFHDNDEPTQMSTSYVRVGSGVPVLRYTRRHIADTGRIVEVAHPIVRRGDTTVVDFVIDLDD